MTWREALEEYYQQHETLNEQNRAWLKKHVLMDIDLIADMTREQVLETFTRHRKFNHTLFIRTVIWQSLGLILSGDEEPLNDNIRGFWYTICDPLYLKFRLYGDITTDDPGFRLFIELRASKRGLVDFTDLKGDSRAKSTYIQDLCGDSLQDYVEQHIFRYQGPFQFISSGQGDVRQLLLPATTTRTTDRLRPQRGLSRVGLLRRQRHAPHSQRRHQVLQLRLGGDQ